MDDEKRKKLDATVTQLDLRLGGLLGKLGDTLAEMADRLEAGEDGEIRRTQEISTPRGPIRAETGIRIRFGGLDTDTARSSGSQPAGVRPFEPTGAHPAQGSSKPAAQRGDAGRRARGTAGSRGEYRGESGRPDVPAGDGTDTSRPPHVETYLDGMRWILCADLPGATLSETDVSVERAEAGAALVVETSGTRQYSFRHALPCEARADEMQIVLRNGILEIAVPLGRGEEAQ